MKIKRAIYADCQKAMTASEIIYFIGGLLSDLLLIYTARVLGEFADAVFQLNDSFILSNLVELIICILITIIIVPAIELLGETVMFANSLSHDRKVLARFLTKKCDKASEISEGEALYRLEDDPSELRAFWQKIAISLLVIPISVIYLLYNTLRISPIFTLVIFFASSIKVVIPLFIKKLEGKYDDDIRSYKTTVKETETDFIRNSQLIQIYSLTSFLKNKIDSLYRECYVKTLKKEIILRNLFVSCSRFLNTFCTLLILFLGAIMIIKNKMSPGELAAMTGYFSILNTIMEKIIYTVKKVPILNNISKRMEVVYSDPENVDGISIPCFESLYADKVSFLYKGKEVLSEISFEIKSGEKVVICGPNGSGKSTLLKIICGILNGYKGRININGIPLSELSIDDFRNKVTYLSQDIYIFPLSLKDNIYLSRPGDCHNKVDEIIRFLGLKDIDNASGISGGEKRKVAIARALFRNSPLILFDEPSNDLDSENLKLLKMLIMKSDYTVIYVSHDNNLIDLADRKIFLQKH